MGVPIDPEYEHSRLSRERRHRAKHRQQLKTAVQSASVYSPLVRVVSPLVWFGLSFLVLDDAICVVGECEFLQCTVPSQHGAVSDDATIRGRDVIFFSV